MRSQNPKDFEHWFSQRLWVKFAMFLLSSTSLDAGAIIGGAKVAAGDEASIRYTLSETDLADLVIPLAMRQYMLTHIPMPYTQREKADSPNKAIF